MKKKRSRVFLLFLLVAMLGVVFFLTLYLAILNRPDPVTPPGQKKGLRSGRPLKRELPRSEPVKPQDMRPKVAIIIDDLGYDLDVDTAFMRTELPLTLSILPLAPFTESIAREAKMRGLEVLLHQPMEPDDYPRVEPGPGALLLSMSPAQIIRVLNENLKQIPGVKGINNHMGSGFTKDRDQMEVVAKALQQKGLFFIDSRTTKETVALEEMEKFQVPRRSRDVFLDNQLAPHAIDRQIGRLLSVAGKTGSAIGIGHPYRTTLEILMKNRERLKKEVHMVPVSALVSHSSNIRNSKRLSNGERR